MKVNEILREMDDDEWSYREDDMMTNHLLRKKNIERNARMKDAGMNAYTVHKKLMNDEAYQYSREHNDVRNMRIVLHAHGLCYTEECANYMLTFEPEEQYL